MLEVLTRANLVHELVLVSVHSRELADVVEGIEDTVGELESVDVAEAVLYLGVDDEFSEAENLAHKMEGISEAGLFALFSSESLDGFEIEVVYERYISIQTF